MRRWLRHVRVDFNARDVEWWSWGVSPRDPDGGPDYEFNIVHLWLLGDFVCLSLPAPHRLGDWLDRKRYEQTIRRRDEIFGVCSHPAGRWDDEDGAVLCRDCGRILDVA